MLTALARTQAGAEVPPRLDTALTEHVNRRGGKLATTNDAQKFNAIATSIRAHSRRDCQRCFAGVVTKNYGNVDAPA